MLVNDKMNGRSPGHRPAPGPDWRRLPARAFLLAASDGRDQVIRGAGILPATLRAVAFPEKPEPSSTQIPPISNRDSKLLETPVTHTKQTTEVTSNRVNFHPVSEANYTVPIKDMPRLAPHH